MSELAKVPLDEYMVTSAKAEGEARERTTGMVIAAALEHEADVLEALDGPPPQSGGEYLRMRAKLYRADD